MGLKHSSVWLPLLLIGFLSQADCQYNRPCSEFWSPDKITTKDSRVGYISLPVKSGSKYKPNQICEWQISTDEDDLVIKLQVERCQLEGVDLQGDCNNDYVDIFDVKEGRQSFMARFCGTKESVGKVFISTGQEMVVRFHSNQAYEYSGFTAKYQASEEEDDDDDSENFLSLMIGIPCGLFALGILVWFTFPIIKKYWKKKQPSRRAFDNIPREGRIVNRESLSRPTQETSSIGNNSTLQIGNMSYGYETSNRRLQAIPPSYSREDPEQVRCATPPPAYESLDYNLAGTGPEGITPATPPPYEEVVKEGIEV